MVIRMVQSLVALATYSSNMSMPGVHLCLYKVVNMYSGLLLHVMIR